MSDTERLALRDLPPVPPVEPPTRLSQTFLRHADRCMRSAYLYLKYRGGTPAVELDFGTAYHLFAEQALIDLIVAGEQTLYAPQEGEDPRIAARSVASHTAAMCDEILRERPELTLPARGTHSRDALRQLAYHFAIGNDINPQEIAAIEKKFVLDLDTGWTVSGKIDVATLSDDPRVGGVHDHKTTFAMPAQGDFEELYQLRLYALLLVFGNPVEPAQCPECHGKPMDGAPIAVCSTCDGLGVVERRLPPIGGDLQWVRARELYPRLLDAEGKIRFRSTVVSRQELIDWRRDLEEQSLKVAEALETWRWPAVPGSLQCRECPCRPECPLPAHLRRHAGEIESNEQAAEAAEWVETTSAQLTATKKELRSYSNVHGPIRYGTDKVYEFSTSESWSTDWENLELAIERARLYGEPLDLSLYRQPRVSTSYRSRKLTAEELEPEVATTEEVLDADARWGSKAPY
jgi:hypothetical protein